MKGRAVAAALREIVEEMRAARSEIVEANLFVVGSDALDARAEGAELVLDALVAAVDVVDAVDQVVLLATRAARTRPALARRSEAVTGAPLSGVGPVTMARLPSMAMLAPMRIISLAWR